MHILVAHNYYQQPGGEDQVFIAETNLLESFGHQVTRYTLHNDQIKQMNLLAVAQSTVWNQSVYKALKELIAQTKPDIVHFHNTFPLISPAAYYAAQQAGIPVVQTLHNYRLLCPNALLLRDGNICESCMNQSLPWPGVVHGCYQNKRVASGVVASMLAVHRWAKTWERVVDSYVTLTEFAREKFIQGGIAPEKLVVKPNFVHPDPGIGDGQGGYALFVGRLAPEKGIETLLSAWKLLDGKVPLKIIGDGPLADRVKAAAEEVPHLQWLGHKPLSEIYEWMKGAAFLVLPSEWYEGGLPRTILESFAVGTPVLASQLGSMGRLIQPEVTGQYFEAKNAQDLSQRAEKLFANTSLLSFMRCQARLEFETRYTAEENYRQLFKIYTSLCQKKTFHEHSSRVTN